MRPKTHGETPRKKDRKEKEKEKKHEEPETHNKKPTKEPSLKGEPALPLTNNKGFFVGVFFWVKFGGGRIGGEGGVFVAGSFAGFGQRVRIGVWPGR